VYLKAVFEQGHKPMGENAMQLMTSGSDSRLHSPPPSNNLEAEVAKFRALVATMQERERRLMELLKVSAPEHIEHHVRNVLNELVLLRTLFDPRDGD
jgi:hypothetical protein